MRSDDFAYHLERFDKMLAETESMRKIGDIRKAIARLRRDIQAGIVHLPAKADGEALEIQSVEQVAMYSYRLAGRIPHCVLDRLRENGSVVYIHGNSFTDSWYMSIACHKEEVARRFLRETLEEYGFTVTTSEKKA